ncbi:MAG: NimC/NimA family protein [Oscillospiraceae bacterium]|nr:NimC/NimA family protein [Oscillospiraceae bacterium]
MREVYDFLKKVGNFYLATTDGDLPRVRIFSNTDLFEGRIYLQTNKTKDVSRQLFANGNVELIAYDGEVWCRISARAVNDDRIAPKQSMIDANPLLRDWFSADDDKTHVVYLADATAKFESLFGEPKTVTF